ncbi:hypothetical protein [Actinopolymorpha sp. B9G3]|uniref:hypothetical protein n=1 Tax=Actinopolymorpha sp. B9G3 TaxID=3158970 RepID=UPI0032D96536
MPTRSLAVLAAMIWVLHPSASASPPRRRPIPAGHGQRGVPTSTTTGRGPDLAIGIPREDLGTQPDAGAVEVRYADRGPQIPYPADYRAGDRFGTSIVTAYVDDDTRSEPIVGAPGQDANGLSDAGAVHIYLGADTGLRYWRRLVQGTDGVPGEAQAGARFGESLAIGGHGLSPAEPHTERLYVGTPGLAIANLEAGDRCAGDRRRLRDRPRPGVVTPRR